MASALRWSAGVVVGVAVALSGCALLGAATLRLLKLWLDRFGSTGSPALATAPIHVILALIVALGGVAAARA